MTLLHLESLPARTTRKELLHFLTEVGKVDEREIGRLDLRGSVAVIEVTEQKAGRLLKALDGVSWKDRRLRVRMSGTPSVAGSSDEHFQRLSRLLALEAVAE